MAVFRASLCLCLVVLMPAPLLAWGSIGHMTVAYVAYQHLTPAAKARVRDLLVLNPDLASWEKQVPAGTSAEDHDRIMFMIAATWADDIKGDSRYSDEGSDPNTADGVTSSQNIGYADLFRHRYWHFIDTPFSPDHTMLPAIAAPNAETEIAAFRAVLASTEPDELKSYDLVWLLHLIGDIHQPLHATTRVTSADRKGDAGGNKVQLLGDASANVHAYWDDLPGLDCSFCSKKIRCVERAATLAKTLKPANPASARNLSVAIWIQESFQAARTVVYRAPIGGADGPYTIAPSSFYETAALHLAKARLALAGARLAEVLNHEMK